MSPNHIQQFFSKEKSKSKSEIQPPNKSPSGNPWLLLGGLVLALTALLSCQSFKGSLELPPLKGTIEFVNKK